MRDVEEMGRVRRRPAAEPAPSRRPPRTAPRGPVLVRRTTRRSSTSPRALDRRRLWAAWHMRAPAASSHGVRERRPGAGAEGRGGSARATSDCEPAHRGAAADPQHPHAVVFGPDGSEVGRSQGVVSRGDRRGDGPDSWRPARGAAPTPRRRARPRRVRARARDHRGVDDDADGHEPLRPPSEAAVDLRRSASTSSYSPAPARQAGRHVGADRRPVVTTRSALCRRTSTDASRTARLCRQLVQRLLPS
jgi:hypothetical protein